MMDAAGITEVTVTRRGGARTYEDTVTRIAGTVTAVETKASAIGRPRPVWTIQCGPQTIKVCDLIDDRFETLAVGEHIVAGATPTPSGTYIGSTLIPLERIGSAQ